MPSNKNAVIRYMYLDQMLSDRYNKYTCVDLLNKVNERLELAGYPTIGGDPSDYERYIKSGKRVIQLDLQITILIKRHARRISRDSCQKILYLLILQCPAGDPRQFRLKQLSDLEHLSHERMCDRRNESAPLRVNIDEVFGLKPLDRLAYRRATHAELLLKLFFRDDIIRIKSPVDDHLLKDRIGFVVL